MSSIVARVKILPTDAGITSKDIVKSIKGNLPSGVSIKNENEEPIAYGLIATILDILLEDKDGSIDALEEAIRLSKIVSQVDIIGISRTSAKIS